MPEQRPKGTHNPSQKSLQRWDTEGGAPKGGRFKRPRDAAQLAKLMIDIASGEVEDRKPERSLEGNRVMRVKIFDLSWNVDLNRLENEINAFLATLPSNAVKYVQSAASSTRTGGTDQMQTDYLVTVWYEGEQKKPAAKKSARR
jgi:hypothetical protein